MLKPFLSLHQAPVLGCEPGPAKPGLAQNVLLTQASPGRDCEQGQQTGLSAPSLAIPGSSSGSGRVGQQNANLLECGLHVCEGPVSIHTTGVGCRGHKCMGPAAHETTFQLWTPRDLSFLMWKMAQ